MAGDPRIVLGIVIIGVHALHRQDVDAADAARLDADADRLRRRRGLAVPDPAEACAPIIWPATLVGARADRVRGLAWRCSTYPFQSLEQAFARAITSGESQEGTNSIGGFTVGIDARGADGRVHQRTTSEGSNAILADNAQTFGVILLTGRPELFFDRVDQGDGTFRAGGPRPYGRVSHMLIAKQASGDLIRRRLPDGGEPRRGRLHARVSRPSATCC